MGHFGNAFVTGASGGLGAAIARELAARGTRVVLAARRREPLEALAQELRAGGGQAEVEVLDVGDLEAARSAVERWDAELGGLDLVVANAGVAPPRGVDPLSWEGVEPVLRVNVLGALATLTAALPLMRARGAGTLAGISSLASVRGMPDSGAYSASKACLSTWLESLQIDLVGTGVLVVDVQPGFVRTPMTDRNTGPMPFLLEVDDAARRTVDGFERGRLVVSYPAGLSWPMRTVMRWMPRWLWVRVMRRVVTGRSDSSGQAQAEQRCSRAGRCLGGQCLGGH